MSTVIVFGSPPYRLAPRGPGPVVVLRSEYGATTCHVFPERELGGLLDLVLGCGDGVELRVFVSQPAVSGRWSGEMTP